MALARAQIAPLAGKPRIYGWLTRILVMVVMMVVDGGGGSVCVCARRAA